jgi:hypothetical protein
VAIVTMNGLNPDGDAGREHRGQRRGVRDQDGVTPLREVGIGPDGKRDDEQDEQHEQAAVAGEDKAPDRERVLGVLAGCGADGGLVGRRGHRALGLCRDRHDMLTAR